MSGKTDILKLFESLSNGKYDRALSLEEISEHIEVPKLKIMDILEELEGERLLKAHPENLCGILYSLTPRGTEYIKTL